MYCNYCGEEIYEGNQFCCCCGRKVLGSRKSTAPNSKTSGVEKLGGKVSRRLFASKFWLGCVCGVLIISILCGVLIGFGAFSQKTEGRGFASPEAAITAYLKAMKKGNINKMISACSVETYVENFDPAEYYDTFYNYTYGGVLPLYPSDSYSRQMLVGLRTGDLYDAIMRQYLYLHDIPIEGLKIAINGQPKEFLEDGEALAELFEDQNWIRKLSRMKVEDVLSAEDVLDEYNRYNENYEKAVSDIEAYLGCDEYVELAVEIHYDGNSGYFCAGVAKYGNKWYVCRLGGQIASWLGSGSFGMGFVFEDDIQKL